jgi:hypothetical protein
MYPSILFVPEVRLEIERLSVWAIKVVVGSRSSKERSMVFI